MVFSGSPVRCLRLRLHIAMEQQMHAVGPSAWYWTYAMKQLLNVPCPVLTK